MRQRARAVSDGCQSVFALVPKLQLGNLESEAPASRDRKLSFQYRIPKPSPGISTKFLALDSGIPAGMTTNFVLMRIAGFYYNVRGKGNTVI